ncbi:hypothetical protein KC929_00650 [Patescibacteria group bacterium]|nr:hypothetical protein [Patescibacteria group bacterium]MCB0688893.1 hypothetical protein [Saprospiraceae bacterium]
MYETEFSGGIAILYLVVIVVTIAGMWRVFQKAGRKGWEAIIPIYNLFIIQKIIGKPWYWVILMMIPYIGIIWTIWSTNLMSKSFGKSEGFTIGMIILPFIFYPILGFGKAQYQGAMGSKDMDMDPSTNSGQGMAENSSWPSDDNADMNDRRDEIDNG